MLKIPDILNSPSFYDAKLDYKWNSNMRYDWDEKVSNQKLFHIFLKLNHKASIGMAAALAEWVYWRLHTKDDIDILEKHIETLWASIIDKRYVKKWEYDFIPGENDKVHGVKTIALESLERSNRNFLDGAYNISAELDGQAMLARYICPDKKLFDSWLESCIRKLIPLFPIEYDRDNPSAYNDDEDPYYDSSHEQPIPREFFFSSDFDYTPRNTQVALDNLLSNLSYTNNELLNTPETMLAEGFIGTSYRYGGE
ncbi:hypothetical protein HCB45_15025 [Listeria sp. FSL L7-0091]|uniref:Uncharacterized protein n=1 Tax=Listeria farberi TaxID=2713500 RepID=A0A7X1DDH9_9LIST|nr:hypothetical protein [Listeria farberi]MBC1374390.1 hypothetical protein [Listeria farberi]MBC1380958.1 hypothetical protein [Listeria farberi]MBC2262857.1 hypothetical protein [Listeria farberi]MBC2267194.1 hypothetical protein [Listeria farberi]MBC2286654.1 hypothetical protein [Listeria farberi]